MHCTLTSKARIAVAAMIDLVLHSRRGPVSLAALSERLQVSLSYLQQIVANLRRRGLVHAVRGPGGGYLLGRQTCDISVADIVLAVDEPPARDGVAQAPDFWAGLSAKLLECLGSVSLHDLACEQDDRPAPHAPKTDMPAPRRGISSRPVLMPIKPTSLNSVFALAEALPK